ncbi:hypothetical protein KAR91_73295 [Candidatus Pacearchaeota archaeon]|nr:hypothetical protein [Candidatus Pacearchaeota archaeon]
MKKLAFIFLVSILFTGCGYEWQPKEEKKQTVFTKDLGNFAVKGDVEYNDDGSIQFTDAAGRKIRLRSYAAVVDASEVEQPKQINKPPVAQPKAKTVPSKDTENKPDK